MQVKSERERRMIVLAVGASVFIVFVLAFSTKPITNPACLPQMNILANGATSECEENPILDKAGIGIAALLGALASLSMTILAYSVVKVKPQLQKES